jgi:hypothetical protein
MTKQPLDLEAIADMIRRLRGVYRIPITDGCGAVGGGDEPDNPDEFVRSFQTPPIQLRAADTLDALTAEVRKLREALDGWGEIFGAMSREGMFHTDDAERHMCGSFYVGPAIADLISQFAALETKEPK